MAKKQSRGELVAKYLRENSLTYRDVAAQTGLGRSTVSDLIAKKGVPTIGTLRQIGGLIGVDWRDLAEMLP